MCENILEYPEKYLYNRSIKENRCCRSCAGKQANEWKRIKSFTRNCPVCNKILEYSVYYTWWWANKHKQCCRTCSHTGKHLSIFTKEKISLSTSGIRNPMYGKHHTDEIKNFISINNRKNKSKTGQVCNADTKMNMRKSAIKRIQIQGTSRSYNPLACEFMDNMKKYNFIHAKNNGDEYQFRGYFADGYDKEKNVWFEYDEPRHYINGILKQKDIDRMNEIMKHLHCKFLRYNAREKFLTEYFNP